MCQQAVRIEWATATLARLAPRRMRSRAYWARRCQPCGQRDVTRKAEASGGLYEGITAWLQENWLTEVHGGETGVWCACDALVVAARPILRNSSGSCTGRGRAGAR